MSFIIHTAKASNPGLKTFGIHSTIIKGNIEIHKGKMERSILKKNLKWVKTQNDLIVDG